MLPFLALTLAVEVPLYTVALTVGWRLPWQRCVLAAVAANAVTHPLLWLWLSTHPAALATAELTLHPIAFAPAAVTAHQGAFAAAEPALHPIAFTPAEPAAHLGAFASAEPALRPTALVATVHLGAFVAAELVVCLAEWVLLMALLRRRDWLLLVLSLAVNAVSVLAGIIFSNVA